MTKQTLLKERLRGDEALLGTFAQLPSPEVVELLGLAGLQFVILDNEHGPLAIEGLGPLLRAAELRGLHTIVRVAENDPIRIQKALDLGAEGILVPRVASRADAERAVAAAYFMPQGARGACPCVRGLTYGQHESPALYATTNERTVVLLLLEGAEAVANAESIATVPGIDGVLLGPVDLAHTLGVPGEPEHPRVTAALATLVERLGRCGVAVGVFAFTLDGAVRWAASGARWLPISVDTTFILTAYRQLQQDFARRSAAVTGP